MRRLAVNQIESSLSSHYVFLCDCGGMTEFDFDGPDYEAFKIAESRCDNSCFDMEGGGD